MVTSLPTPSTSHSTTQKVPYHPSPRPLKIQSSWISSIAYRRVDGVGFLAIFTREDKRTGKAPYALLYGPSERAPQGVPPWVAGLVQAGIGGVSVGRAYGKVVKQHQAEYEWGYERVEGEERVNDLKEMMK